MGSNVFEYGYDEETAYLNWRTKKHEPIHNMMTLAEGYVDAAKLMSERCLEDNEDRKADVIAFPILFSLNQGIELYVKSLCWSINILLGYKSRYMENHDIRGIWYTTKEKIKQYGFDYSEGRGEAEFYSMIEVLEDYLNELYEKIGDGDINNAYVFLDFSRYPLDIKFKNQFYVDEKGNSVANLRNVYNIANDIGKSLDALTSYYYDLVLKNLEG